jgi:hypothetical protein
MFVIRFIAPAVCCGFCCDYRRAVIWSNNAMIGILCFVLVMQTTLDDSVDTLYYWDDGVSNEVNEIYDEYLSRLNIFGYVAILTSFGSVISAVLFSLWIPILNIVWLITTLIASIFILQNMYEELKPIYATTTEVELTSPTSALVAMAIVVAGMIYPNLAYVLEVKRGILTKETYPREERCCCCSG